MLLEGHVEDGRIVLDQPAALPEGTKVRVQVMTPNEVIAERIRLAKLAPDIGPTLAERMARSVGTALDLPEDFATRHDHYIHGVDG